MNKENALQTSPEITAEQKARISQKFRAAKALLARKRPFDNLLKNESPIGAGNRVPLVDVGRNQTPLVPAKCGRTSGINSVKRPYCTAPITTHNHSKYGDRTGISRVPLQEVHINTPCSIPPKCGIINEINSIRSCPESISNKRNDYCVSYGQQILVVAVEDELKSGSAVASVKQSKISEETPKKSDIDSVNYGSGIVEAPVEAGSISGSFNTPLRQSECANLNEAFSSVADLDEVFDESILQQIDALCEERSGRKLRQHESPHGDLSGTSQSKENDGMTRTSLGSLNVDKDIRPEGFGYIDTGNFPKAYSDYLQSLNDQQKEAACSDISTPLMIVAGPGSGKTSTMVGRVLMLLNEGISPNNILATTFTTAAASEMRDRIGSVAGKEVAKQLTISTFHSFCLQLCRTHAEKLGRTEEFLIYGHGQQRRAIIEAVRLFESKKNMDENLDPSKIDQYGDMSCAQHFKDKSKKWQKFVTQAKASGRTPSDCRKKGDEIGAMILENYDGILKSCNALDYHDLISCSVSLLTDFPGVCAETQDLWKAMVIDEFQDTSSMQYNLLRILASHNRITIVGDEDQSIFSFNGADVSGFDSFRKDFPNHKEVRLTKNYRSTRIIVEAASSLIRNNVNRCQIKQALTDNCSGSKITVKECHNEDAQCAFVTDKILEFTAGDSDVKTSFGNIAILYRRQVSGKVFQTAFRNRKIPFNIHGVAFYRKKIIKTIMAMLRTTLPGCDDSAFRQTFKTILTVEKEEKKKVIDYIDRICTIRKCSFISAARDIFAAKISGTFKRSQLSQGRKVLSTLDIISKLVHREQSISAVITSVSNMLPQKYLLEQRAVVDADGGKLLNEDSDLRPVLQYLLDDVSSFLANHFNGTDMEKNSIAEESGCTNILKAFIDYISLRESENFRSRRQDNKDSVTLTTIHQSKGLEWDVVFIVKANDAEIPLLHEFNGSANGTRTSLEEERRLLYVAMTRARKKLYILYVTVDSNWQLLQPSRFLREIPDHLREVQTELSGMELQNMKGDLSSGHVEISDGIPRPVKHSDIETGALNDQTSEIVSNESVEALEYSNGDSFLKSFNVEDRGMISQLFHQWARKKAFKEPKRLLDKIGFVIDERLRIKAKKQKDVLSTLKSRLSSGEAFQFAENVLRWEKLPAEKRAHLTREKQEHFQKLRIENAMGSSEATPKQVAYLQSLGCTVAPTSRLHASRLIEQYKSL